MIQLKSARGIQAINLAHDVVCEGGECLCSKSEHRAQDHNPKTGDVGVRLVDRLICKSVFLIPGQWSEELPECVEKLPEVAAGLRSGALAKREAELAPEAE